MSEAAFGPQEHDAFIVLLYEDRIKNGELVSEVARREYEQARARLESNEK